MHFFYLTKSKKYESVQIHDDFNTEFYMPKTFWEPQLVEELRKYSVNARQTEGKTNWDVEIDGIPFAQLKCLQ